ncbi:hypothetical protein [Pelomonas cellulosilytica]|uniref:DUF4136 domain-containing protein n=1 Tax=Pelomonas cellulosilytica TaxID=2906762 RepID=A0ABS8XLE1_9BURK|nr:hypothetical protein [Pelomonas sp. P8]MCE4553624.1 hypothetical protein [Pelomonas sp. P8]
MRFTTAALLLSFGLAGPAAADAPSAPPVPPASAAAPAAPTEHQRTYYFEHRLLPGWVHKSAGSFYADLSSGKLNRLLDAAREVVSPEFSAGLKVTPRPELDGVLVEYPAPKTMPLCYFAFVHANPKSETGYDFYTYEKTMVLPGMEDVVGVVGSWSPNGTHANMGTRTYQDAESFLRDLKLEKAPPGV